MLNGIGGGRQLRQVKAALLPIVERTFPSSGFGFRNPRLNRKVREVSCGRQSGRSEHPRTAFGFPHLPEFIGKLERRIVKAQARRRCGNPLHCVFLESEVALGAPLRSAGIPLRVSAY